MVVMASQFWEAFFYLNYSLSLFEIVILKVMNTLDANNKPDITYPCQWEYKIIGLTPEEMSSSVAQILDGRDYKLNMSNVSRTGKYTSLTISLLVENEEDRLSIFNNLSGTPTIKMVI